MADYITTYTKIRFTPLEPQKEDICIRDIAHALSMMCRANGHFPVFYSVAQHCVHCCEEAKARGYTRRVQLACLLHDASEAYLADITRPVKRNLDQYREIEAVLQDMVFEKYLGELSEEENRLWQLVDDALLYHEFDCLMDEKLQEDPQELSSHPSFEPEPLDVTEKKYLECFERLSAG